MDEVVNGIDLVSPSYFVCSFGSRFSTFYLTNSAALNDRLNDCCLRYSSK